LLASLLHQVQVLGELGQVIDYFLFGGAIGEG
jgi:hypothetical protein